MNCPRCQEPFDDVQRVPRVLVQCGHTICEVCLAIAGKNGFVQCPECGKLQYGSPSSFPKNLTLLSLKSNSGIHTRPNEQCQVHRKPFEGFCEKDKQLLCVSCILEEQHRSHSISSIEQTVAKDKEILDGANQRILKSRDEILRSVNSLQSVQERLDDSYHKCLEEIFQFYQTLRESLANREQQTKAAAGKIYQAEADKLESTKRQLADKYEFFGELLGICSTVGRLSNIEYLNEANKRLFIMENSHYKPMKTDTQLRPLAFNRQDEVRKVMGFLQTMESDIRKKPEKAVLNVKKRSIKQDKKMPVVLQLNLTEKYQRHLDRKNTQQGSQRIPAFEEEKFNLSDIGCKASRVSISSNSFDDIMRPGDMSISIKDHNSSMVHIVSRIYHVGGIGANGIQAYDLSEKKSGWLGHHVERTGLQVVVYPDDKQDKLLILGGKDLSSRKLDSALIFDTTFGTMQSINFKLSSAKSNFSAVTHNSLLYVLGGSDIKSVTSLFEQYQVVGNHPPKRLKNMTTARQDFCAVIGYDGRLYAMGGSDAKAQTLSSCERYDFAKGKWEQIASMNTARKSFAAVSLPDGIYAVGGAEGDNRCLNEVERYDYYSDKWERLQPMAQRRCSLTAVASPDYQNLYVFGGFGDRPSKSIEAYSILEGRWEPAEMMCAERQQHASCVIRQRM